MIIPSSTVEQAQKHIRNENKYCRYIVSFFFFFFSPDLMLCFILTYFVCLCICTCVGLSLLACHNYHNLTVKHTQKLIYNKKYCRNDMLYPYVFNVCVCVHAQAL